jgi:hypothetical protein
MGQGRRLAQGRGGDQQAPETPRPFGHGEVTGMVAKGAQGSGQGGVAGVAVAALQFREQGAAPFDATQKGREGGRHGRSFVQMTLHQGTGGFVAAS